VRTKLPEAACLSTTRAIPKGQPASQKDETARSLKTTHLERREPELALIAPHEIESNRIESSENYRSC
jgi:hypothetical protein